MRKRLYSYQEREVHKQEEEANMLWLSRSPSQDVRSQQDPGLVHGVSHGVCHGVCM